MTSSQILDELGATTPEDLLREYRTGRRDFSRINLLRRELEPAVTDHSRPDCLDYPGADVCNPLWLDFHFRSDFDWDQDGRCASLEFGDSLPPPILSGLNLAGIILAGSYLYPINFAGADLSYADLRRTVFIDCDLSGATLVKADLRGAYLRNCTLAHCDLSKARMERATLTYCDLRDSKFTETVLSLARLRGVDLRGACLKSARCKSMTLAGDLRNVDLQTASFPNARIGGLRITADQLDPLLTALGIAVDNTA